MADVTISQLPQGIPSGDNILPYSTSSNTLGVPISAIFQNTKAIGIGTSKPSPIGLTIRTGYAESSPLGGPVPLLLSGGDTNSFMAFHVDLDNLKKTCITDNFGARAIVFDNSSGATNLQLWNNNVEAIRIIANNNVGIGTITPSDKLHVIGDIRASGNLLLRGARIQECFFETGEGNSVPSNQYYHYKTNIPISSDCMYRIKAEGYHYQGANKLIEGWWSGYAFNAGNEIIGSQSINNSVASNFCNRQYKSSDGFVVLVGFVSGTAYYYNVYFSFKAGNTNPFGRINVTSVLRTTDSTANLF